MSSNLNKTQKSSTLKVIKKNLQELFEGSLFVTIVQGFSKGSFYRLASYKISEYENLFITKTNTALENRYSLKLENVDDTKKLLEEVLKSTKEEHLAFTLKSAQQIFNYIKKHVRIGSVEELELLEKILETNRRHLRRLETFDERFLDFVLESPFILRAELERQNLLPTHWGIKEVTYKDRPGYLFYESEPEDKYTSTNKFPVALG